MICDFVIPFHKNAGELFERSSPTKFLILFSKSRPKFERERPENAGDDNDEEVANARSEIDTKKGIEGGFEQDAHRKNQANTNGKL